MTNLVSRIYSAIDKNPPVVRGRKKKQCEPNIGQNKKPEIFTYGIIPAKSDGKSNIVLGTGREAGKENSGTRNSKTTVSFQVVTSKFTRKNKVLCHTLIPISLNIFETQHKALESSGVGAHWGKESIRPFLLAFCTDYVPIVIDSHEKYSIQTIHQPPFNLVAFDCALLVYSEKPKRFSIVDLYTEVSWGGNGFKSCKLSFERVNLRLAELEIET